MRHIFLSISVLTAVSLGGCQQSDAVSHANEASLQLNGQVFLRNEFSFEGNRSSEGASASFIQKNDTIYVLTAKHLLGPDMGISPAIQPSEFNDLLVNWVVYHNDNYQAPLAKVTEIFKPNNREDEDLILLKTNATPKDLRDIVLPTTNKLPMLGETLFAIGCPYSEGEACKQRNLIVMKTHKPPNSLSGFSGASLLNKNGEIVAVIFGGDEEYLVGTLLPDWVFE